MNSVDFKEDFTNLIRRWTTSNQSQNETPERPSVILSSQEIVRQVNDVLRTVLQQPNVNSTTMHTPNTGIVVVTPNAPAIPKHSHEHNFMRNRYKSLEVLSTCNNENNNDNAEIGTPLKKDDSKSLENMIIVEGSNMSDANGNEEKLQQIVKSNTTHNLTDIGRSNTYVRENEVNGENLAVVGDCSEFDKYRNLTSDEFREIFKKIDYVKEQTITLEDMLIALKKKLVPETTRPIRRLSSIGTFPGLSCGTKKRAIPRPKISRMSFPATPTTTHPTLSNKDTSPSKIKPTSTTVSHDGEFDKSAVSAINKSMNLHGNKRSSISSTSNGESPTLRPSKNPKYAHVKSTIPRPSSVRREFS